MRSRRVFIGVVAALLVPGPARASAPPSEPLPEAAAATSDAGEFFASAGVTVTPIDDPSVGVGLSLTDWQADNLLRQARAGEGWTGAQWRERFPLPDDIVPVDFVIAGWLAFEDTAAASAARQLTDPAPLLDTEAPLDPADLVIPPAVAALFLHDVAISDIEPEAATAASTVPAPTGLRRPAPRPAEVDACEGLLTFYDGALASIYDAVGGKDSTIGRLAQQAVGLLPIPKPSYHVPTKTNMGTFQSLGLLIGLAGAINPWTISITASPDPIAYGVAPGVGNEGVARLVVDPGVAVEWPAPLKSCASLAGIDLPDISPVGAVVTWDPITQGLAPHATVIDHTEVVMSDGSQYYAELRYRTSVESAEQAAGTPTYSALAIVAQVARPGDQTFKGVVDLAIQRYLGPDSTFGAILGSLVAPLVESLDEINSPLPAFAFPTVTFHLPGPPPEPPVASAPPVPAEPDEPWAACVGRDLYSQAAGSMPAGILLRISADGTGFHYDFSASAPSTSSAGGVNVTVQLSGTIEASGTPSGDVFTTTVSAGGIGLAGVMTVDGTTVAMDSAMFQDLLGLDTGGGGGETLRCTDGAITVERTGQVYS